LLRKRVLLAKDRLMQHSRQILFALCLANAHVVYFGEALARAISADDNRLGHCPGRKWPNGVAF
jgi:hypothetical protein